jgi:hypothetical protein
VILMILSRQKERACLFGQALGIWSGGMEFAPSQTNAGVLQTLGLTRVQPTDEMDVPLGLEPRLTGSEPDFLPLEEGTIKWYSL